MNSKSNFINYGCQPSKIPGDDVSVSLFGLTLVLDDASSKLTKEVKFA